MADEMVDEMVGTTEKPLVVQTELWTAVERVRTKGQQMVAWSVQSWVVPKAASRVGN